MQRPDDETLRELGKTKYAAKTKLCCYMEKTTGAKCNPDYLMDVLWMPDEHWQDYALKKLQKLRLTLENNPFSAVPAAVFVLAGEISAELREEIHRIDGNPKTARRIRAVALTGTEEEKELLIPAAEIVLAASAHEASFFREGALCASGTSFDEYFSNWESLAQASGTLSFLQKSYETICQYS